MFLTKIILFFPDENQPSPSIDSADIPNGIFSFPSYCLGERQILQNSYFKQNSNFISTLFEPLSLQKLRNGFQARELEDLVSVGH